MIMKKIIILESSNKSNVQKYFKNQFITKYYDGVEEAHLESIAGCYHATF